MTIRKHLLCAVSMHRWCLKNTQKNLFVERKCAIARLISIRRKKKENYANPICYVEPREFVTFSRCLFSLPLCPSLPLILLFDLWRFERCEHWLSTTLDDYVMCIMIWSSVWWRGKKKKNQNLVQTEMLGTGQDNFSL